MTVTWEETQQHLPLFGSVAAPSASQTMAAFYSSVREPLTVLPDRLSHKRSGPGRPE